MKLICNKFNNEDQCICFRTSLKNLKIPKQKHGKVYTTNGVNNKILVSLNKRTNK